MKKLTNKQRNDVNLIINTCSALTGAAGFAGAQLPVADNLVITPIQVAMIIGIGKIMGVKISEGVANGIIKSAAAAFVGRGISQVVFSILPGIANAANTITAAALTQFVGRLAIKDFTQNADKYEKEKREYSAEEITNEIKERFGKKEEHHKSGSKNISSETTINIVSETETDGLQEPINKDSDDVKIKDKDTYDSEIGESINNDNMDWEDQE